MNHDRREQLESRLTAALACTQDGMGPMSVLCQLALGELSVDGVGATVLSRIGDGEELRRGLVHATNEVSARLEELQLTVGEGPCLDAFASGGPVFVTDLATATGRWPGFAPGALEVGAVTVFSFPLHIGVYRLGSLDCYREASRSLTGAETSDALILADLATQAVIGELEGHRSQDTSWLADPHAEVHQATGMVQVQLRTTTEAAFLRLRAHAYTHQLPLDEAARLVTTRALRFTPDDIPPDRTRLSDERQDP